MGKVKLVPIGEAARRLGLRTSALRYYEERGLVRPPLRADGQRRYGPQELRRLTFIKIAKELSLPLDAAAAVLDEPGEQWRAVIGEQIAELDALIVRAQSAKAFLAHARLCPEEHPVRDCPVLIGILDRLLDGASLEQIAGEHAGPDERNGPAG
jgi:DNA-binding transcriptional MerR regulator